MLSIEPLVVGAVKPDTTRYVTVFFNAPDETGEYNVFMRLGHGTNGITHFGAQFWASIKVQKSDEL